MYWHNYCTRVARLNFVGVFGSEISAFSDEAERNMTFTHDKVEFKFSHRKRNFEKTLNLKSGAANSQIAVLLVFVDF